MIFTSSRALSVAILFACCCQRAADPPVSGPNCRPAGTITTGTGPIDVPILSLEQRFGRIETQALLANFDHAGKRIAQDYCLNHPQPCAWVYAPAGAADIKRRCNFQFAVPPWRLLPYS